LYTKLDLTLSYLDKSYTVFAPNNKAFDKIGYDMLTKLSNAEIENILLYHVIAGKEVFKSDLVCDSDVEMANGLFTETQCEIVRDSDRPYDKKLFTTKFFQVGTANDPKHRPEIISFDIEACNGVIHVVDNVILPAEQTESPTGAPTATASGAPSGTPSANPSDFPSDAPSGVPSDSPSGTPSVSEEPSTVPTLSEEPSEVPTLSLEPSVVPTVSQGTSHNTCSLISVQAMFHNRLSNSISLSFVLTFFLLYTSIRTNCVGRTIWRSQ
jgi:hypothetical protein